MSRLRRASFALALALATPALADPPAPTAAPSAEPSAPSAPRTDGPPVLRFSPEVRPPDEGEPLPANASVRLELTIDATGAVTEARVLDGLDPALDALVLEASRSMRFEPAMREGTAVPARVRFRFRLTRAPVARPAVLPATVPTAAPSAAPARMFPPRRNRPAPVAGDDGAVTVRARVEAGAATRTSLRAEELTSVPGTFGEPLRVVASLPGVGRSPLGFGFFLVRGASFENTGFFIDGFPVLNLYHFGAGPSVIASRFVSQLDFYPGNYPVAYGRYSAGLISVRTEAPRVDRLHADLEIDLFRASAFAAAPFANGRGTIAAAARRSYYDPFLSLIVPGVQLSFGDAELMIDYKFTDRLRGNVFAFTSSDTFNVGHLGPFYPSTRRTGLQYDYTRVIGRLDYRPSARVNVTVGLMAGTDSVQVLTARRDDGSNVSHLQGGVAGQRATLRVVHGASLTTTAGWDLLAQGYRSVALSPNAAIDGSAYTQISAAAHIEEALRVGRLELVAGVRLDYVRYQGIERWLPDPRVVARVRVAQGLTAIASTGFFRQVPNALLLVAGIPLPPQRAWQNSLGVEWEFRDWFDARVTGYFNWLYDLPRTGGVVPAFAGAGASFDLDAPVPFDGEGRAYGVEFMLRRRLERGIYGWVTYTVSRSERFTPGVPGVRLFNYDQTHVFNAAASWKVHPRWRIGARFQLATGTPAPTYSGGVFNADSSSYDGWVSLPDGRTPISNQLDVRVDHFFTWGPARMTAFLDIINVYNAQNGDLGWTYRYDYATRVPGGGLPFLPTIGLRGEL